MRALLLLLMSCGPPPLDYDFNTAQKDATPYTAAHQQVVQDELPFDEKTDFTWVDRGKIAPLTNEGVIPKVFDAASANFVQGKPAPDTVNPSLWRQAQLVNRGGLFEVADGIYQVRGVDISNLTILEGDDGIVLYDICFAAESLDLAIKLYREHRGERPLKGIVISHSHPDHFGGIRGLISAGVTTPEALTSGEIPILVPKGYLNAVISESILMGPIMGKRASYQYGNVLQDGPKGFVSSGLGIKLATGTSDVAYPTRVISKDNTIVTLDGIDFEFYLAPESEAPAEMFFYLPERKALSMAEDANHTLHNTYTLRGARIRDPRLWAGYINGALDRWGDEVQVHFGPHTWPVWGNEEVRGFLEGQRNLYKSIHDQTVRYANHGYRPREIAESVKLPEKIGHRWANRPYYGAVRNNLMATFVYYLGWYNGNPVELARHPDRARGLAYQDAFGGPDQLLRMAVGVYERGDYRFVVDLLDHIVVVDDKNERARMLMADAFEQLGYQEENGIYRNWFLTAASELRAGKGASNPVPLATPEQMALLPLDNLLQVIAAQVNPAKAAELPRTRIALDLPGEPRTIIDLQHGVLNVALGAVSTEIDLTLTMDKARFTRLLLAPDKAEQILQPGDVDGDLKALGVLGKAIDPNMLPGDNLVLTPPHGPLP